MPVRSVPQCRFHVKWRGTPPKSAGKEYRQRKRLGGAGSEALLWRAKNQRRGTATTEEAANSASMDNGWRLNSTGAGRLGTQAAASGGRRLSRGDRRLNGGSGALGQGTGRKTVRLGLILAGKTTTGAPETENPEEQRNGGSEAERRGERGAGDFGGTRR